MKKLIIAAAVAAVGVGAIAADRYDFTATLKTTKGKMSGVQTATYNLGTDAFGNFWYDDTSITNVECTIDGVLTNVVLNTSAYAYLAAATNTDTKTIKGVSGIKSLKLVNKKGVVLASGAGYLFNPTPVQVALAIKLANKYDNKSAGVWCETFKVDSEGCYRVAGSAKINIDLYTTNCCEVAAVFTNNFAGVTTKDYQLILGPYQTNITVQASVTPYFIRRFGALTSARANKAEMYAWATLPTTADGRWFTGELAGQGTWSNGRATSVSGNIVGQMDPALCPHCCVLPVPAVAFNCDDTNPNAYLTTAAYGTFRFKYRR